MTTEERQKVDLELMANMEVTESACLEFQKLPNEKNAERFHNAIVNQHSFISACSNNGVFIGRSWLDHTLRMIAIFDITTMV